MSLKLLYFARLREIVGTASEELDIPQGVTDVAGLRVWLAARGGPWQQGFGGGIQVRAAINHELVSDSMTIIDGAEIAFFPPVTGG